MGKIILPKGTKSKVKKYLIDIVKDEDTSRFKKASIREIRRVALAEKFANENERRWYNYNAKHAIRDWFQGLGMSVDFTYYDIANRMRSWGFKVNEDDDNDYYRKCEMYWYILAEVVFEGR